jgi:hypothetical protein
MGKQCCLLKGLGRMLKEAWNGKEKNEIDLIPGNIHRSTSKLQQRLQ